MAASGKLREVIEWFAPVRTADPSGQQITTMISQGTQRARIVEAKGREEEKHAEQTPVHTHRIEFRSRTYAVLHDWEAKWITGGNRIMQVQSVAPLADQGTDFTVAYAVLTQPSTQ